MYVTITDESNNVLFFDYAPFVWNSGTYSGTIRLHVSSDPSCVSNSWFYFTMNCLTCLCNPPVAEPTLACWETAVLNSSTCQWEISGTQPEAPTNLACYETASFDENTCSWVVSGTAPVATISSSTGNTLNCSNPSTVLTATGGSTVWTQAGVFFGTANPILVTYFTSGSITYGVTVTDANGCTASTDIVITMEEPSAPTNLACYETATFNYNSCQWEASGVQPEAPTNLACYESASFDDNTCEWVVSGNTNGSWLCSRGVHIVLVCLSLHYQRSL